MKYKLAKSKLPMLTQLITPHLVSKLARKYGIDKHARTFTAWSHVVNLLSAHLTHSIGLNDVCGHATSSFTLGDRSRLLAIVRGLIWGLIDLMSSLKPYRAAGESDRMWATYETAYLVGLAPSAHGTARAPKTYNHRNAYLKLKHKNCQTDQK